MTDHAPIQTTCPYCGVGCGVLAHPDGRITADPTHPANYGRLCSKGAALAETLPENCGDTTRLLHPLIDGDPAPWETALDLIATKFRDTIAQHGPDSVAFYVSGQCLTEDYYVANKLMKGFIGAANIDTNSRLCMASTVAGHIRAFGADIVPGTYDDLEQADLIVLVGSNLAWCHPVLFQRIQAARTKLVVIDPRRTATCEGADLHLPLAPGSDVALFAGLLDHLHTAGALDQAWIDRHTTGLPLALDAARNLDVPTITGLDPADIARFYALFAATPRTVTIFSQGVNQSTSGTDKVNAIINVHLATGRIGQPGAGPFSVTGQPNAMGGREVGGLANQLAAHMRFDHPGAADRLRRFWNAPALLTRPGLKAVDLFEAVHAGTIRALWIICTNPADSMPRADRIRDALRACPFVVVSDAWPTDTTALAQVVLPAAAWGERDGTVTNSERRISRQRAFRPPPGQARPDWWALAQIGQRLGHPEAFAWPGPADIFREHAALTAFENAGTRPLDLSALADITDAAYQDMPPIQWPVTPTTTGGRLFAQGNFPTPDGRARFIPTTWRPIAQSPTPDFPFLLNTGRVRDQWHTMTRTGLVPKLLQHVPEPTAAIHPADAAALGLTDRALVRLSTEHAAATLRCAIDPAQRRGEIFVPMHWADSFAAAGPIARLVGAACDPVSGQPELKATPVRATALPTAWRGLLLHAAPVRPSCPVWSRIPLDTGHAFDLASDTPLPADIPTLAQTLMQPGDCEILELSDPGRGTWRFAALRNDRLRSCLYLTTRPDGLPSSQALSALLTRVVETTNRAALLAGTARTTPRDPLICACFSVGIERLRAAIAAQNLTTVPAIGAALQAGTNCGSCIPELKKLLRERTPALA